MDYTSVSADIREYLDSKFGVSAEEDISKNFALIPDRWRKVPANAPDDWAVGEAAAGEEQPWAWWVPCSLTGQWRSRTASESKQASQGARDILSLVVVRHADRIFRTFIGVVYDSSLYELNYPKRQGSAAGRSNTKGDRFRQLALDSTADFVFVQPALSCHALCINKQYKRGGKRIQVDIFRAADFSMTMPAGAALHSRDEGAFALSRYARAGSATVTGVELRFLFAFSPADTFWEGRIQDLFLRAAHETFECLEFVLQDGYEPELVDISPEETRLKSKHVISLFKSQGKKMLPKVRGFKLHFYDDRHKRFSTAESTAFGNLVLHFLRVALGGMNSDEGGDCVVAPIDDDATLEVFTTAATIPGMKDLSKGLPDQTYTQRTLTMQDATDKDKQKSTETIKSRTMDLYGHTRVDIERFKTLGAVLLARDFEQRSGFRSLHPELENVQDILGIQRFLPSISHTTQAITVAPLSQTAYKTNPFAARYARGLNFMNFKSASSLLYPLSVYTPNFESVHSLLSSEMARIVSHRMRKLRMTDADADFAHAWMYNAVRGQVWSPSGPWSSGRFHPRIVSALASRRENLIDCFYYARMVLPSGAMRPPPRFNFSLEYASEPLTVYGHLAFVRELARESLQLYSTCGTVVQPSINQMCLGQLYRRVETRGDTGERTENELKRLLFEPFGLVDDAETLRVGNMNLFEIAKSYVGVIQL